jgi:hypothetical protein
LLGIVFADEPQPESVRTAASTTAQATSPDAAAARTARR